MEKENIKYEFKNGEINRFVTQKTEDLSIPSLAFETQEETELAIAVAKTLKVYDKNVSNLGNVMPYVLRVLGIKNSWTE